MVKLEDGSMSVALENLSTCENRIWYDARKKKQYGISWGM
jgi:hypothetical protein